MALGYPDRTSKLSAMATERRTLGNFCKVCTLATDAWPLGGMVS